MKLVGSEKDEIYVIYSTILDGSHQDSQTKSVSRINNMLRCNVWTFIPDWLSLGSARVTLGIPDHLGLSVQVPAVGRLMEGRVLQIYKY